MCCFVHLTDILIGEIIGKIFMNNILSNHPLKSQAQAHRSSSWDPIYSELLVTMFDYMLGVLLSSIMVTYVSPCLGDLCRVIKMSSPNINNLILLGCVLCFTNVLFADVQSSPLNNNLICTVCI